MWHKNYILESDNFQCAIKLLDHGFTTEVIPPTMGAGAFHKSSNGFIGK